jgi:hypothetical protein
MDQVTYGVFRLGQIWSVVSEDGARLGFVSRERALAAAQALVSNDVAAGRPAQIAVQDEDGLLTTIRPLDG